MKPKLATLTVAPPPVAVVLIPAEVLACRTCVFKGLRKDVCHRWPPTLVTPSQTHSAFPPIPIDGWCGEHLTLEEWTGQRRNGK